MSDYRGFTDRMHGTQTYSTCVGSPFSGYARLDRDAPSLKLKMATSGDTTLDSVSPTPPHVEVESDSEYLDAEEDFHPQSSVNPEPIKPDTFSTEAPNPVPPPRTKRKLKKNKSSGAPNISNEVSNVIKVTSSPVSQEKTVEKVPNSHLHDPFVTIKEEGLLMNPELLRNSEVTVTSETPLKPSGRAKECQPGEIVILSDGDSAEEEPKVSQMTLQTDQMPKVRSSASVS